MKAATDEPRVAQMEDVETGMTMNIHRGAWPIEDAI